MQTTNAQAINQWSNAVHTAFTHLDRASSWDDASDRAQTVVVRGFAQDMARMHARLAQAAFDRANRMD